MPALDNYRKRLGHKSTTSRDRWLSNTQQWLNKKLPNSLSYYTVNVDGEERRCAVLSTQNTNERRICTMPGERLSCGSYVEWMDNTWLITELDAPYEVYQGALMVQCNYLLKWVNDDGEIVERWCVVNDGTKYLTGEYFQQFMTVGDSRVQLTIPKDNETMQLSRGRRFLIDNDGVKDPMAYEISKVNRNGSVYNQEGVYVHMLTESACCPDDNIELMIANYYSRIKTDEPVVDEQTQSYIAIGDSAPIGDLLVGTTYSAPVTVYVDGTQTETDDVLCEIDCTSNVATIQYSSGVLSVTANRNRDNIGTIVTITVSVPSLSLTATKQLEVKGWS